MIHVAILPGLGFYPQEEVMAMATAASLSATAPPSSRCCSISHAHAGFIRCPRLASATFFKLCTTRQRSVLQSALRSPIRATGEVSAVSTQEESATSTQEEFVGSAASTEEASAAPTQEEPVASAEDAGQQGLENVAAGDGQEGEVEEKKPRVVYPKGLNRYETMAVLRPDITEEQRLALSQRYEETIIATGGMDVEIFNRGIMPLAYAIMKTNTQGAKTTYVDGIYYMFTYATKPASQKELQKKLEKDDDLIRVMTFKLK